MWTASRRSTGLIVALALTLAAPAATRAAVCERPSDQGYADGLAGKTAGAEAFARCPDAERAYRTAYGAGAFVARPEPGGRRAPIRAGDRAVGGSDGDPGRAGYLRSNKTRSKTRSETRSTLRLSRCGGAQASGAAGAPLPRDCLAAPGARRAYERGRALRRAQAGAAASAMERARIRTQLQKPTTTAADRRLIQNRLRALDRADALRRLRDPFNR